MCTVSMYVCMIKTLLDFANGYSALLSILFNKTSALAGVF